MSQLATRALTRLVTAQVEEHAEGLRERGAVDRRAFLRLMGLGLVAPLVAACNASGSERTK